MRQVDDASYFPLALTNVTCVRTPWRAHSEKPCTRHPSLRSSHLPASDTMRDPQVGGPSYDLTSSRTHAARHSPTLVRADASGELEGAAGGAADGATGAARRERPGVRAVPRLRLDLLRDRKQ